MTVIATHISAIAARAVGNKARTIMRFNLRTETNILEPQQYEKGPSASLQHTSSEPNAQLHAARSYMRRLEKLIVCLKMPPNRNITLSILGTARFCTPDF